MEIKSSIHQDCVHGRVLDNAQRNSMVDAFLPTLSSIKTVFILVSALVFLGACSSARKVYPAPGGAFRVFSEHSNRFKAQEKALNTAELYCKNDGKQVKILRENINSDYQQRDKVRRDADRAEKTYEVIGGEADTAKKIKNITQVLPQGSNFRAEILFECN